MKVKDIGEIALINKTTFYKHYQDVFSLSYELENEAVELFLENFSSKDCLFSDPQKFIEDIPQALENQRELLFILFDNRMDILIPKIEKQLKEYYRKPGQSEQEDILLTFVIGGTLHTLKELKFEGKYGDATLSKNVAKLIARLHIKHLND